MPSLPEEHRLHSVLPQPDDKQVPAATAAGCAKRKLGTIIREILVGQQTIPAGSPCVEPTSQLGANEEKSFETPETRDRSTLLHSRTCSKSSNPEPSESRTCSKSSNPESRKSSKSSLQERRRSSSLTIDCPAPEGDLQNCHGSGCSLQDQYDLGEKLGQGSSGFVRKAIRKSDKLQVAIKTMRAFDEEMILIRRQEFELLRKLEHPNIVKAIDFFVAQDQAVLVLEYFNSRTLRQAISIAPGRMLSEPVAKLLTTMLLQAVEYLHQSQIVHRDIKAENVLVTPDVTQLRLIDFNTARSMLDGGSLTMTGTMLYLAPEVLQGTSASESADVWSAGLCLHEMLTGRLPWQGGSIRSMADYAKKIIGSPLSSESEQWQRLSNECKALLQLCLQVDADLRPTPTCLLQHEWFHPNAAGLVAATGSAGASESCTDSKEGAASKSPKGTKSSFFRAWATRSIAKVALIWPWQCLARA